LSVDANDFTEFFLDPAKTMQAMLNHGDQQPQKCFKFNHVKFDSCKGTFELLNKSSGPATHGVIDEFVGRNLDVQFIDSASVNRVTKKVESVSFPRLQVCR
jgi:hypothetical protein